MAPDSFRQKVCRLQRLYTGKSTYDCEHYSIWEFGKMYDPPANVDPYTYICSADYFGSMFVFMLVLSFFGVLQHTVKFIRLLLLIKNGRDHLVPQRRVRIFAFFSNSQLRRFRLTGHFIMTAAWLLLLYGVTELKPGCFSPWLILTTVSVSVDAFFLSLDYFVYRRRLTIMSFMVVIFPMLNLYCASCVQWYIDRAYKQTGESAFTWWN